MVFRKVTLKCKKFNLCFKTNNYDINVFKKEKEKLFLKYNNVLDRHRHHIILHRPFVQVALITWTQTREFAVL